MRRQRERVTDHFAVGIADDDFAHQIGGEHRFHAIAADPARAEETELHGTTTAFTKLPGRSRVASSASPKRSSEYRWVINIRASMSPHSIAETASRMPRTDTAGSRSWAFTTSK